ncbi:MAG: CoA transferase [Bacillaceae bacterium]|jgi:formyl-CoA transferase|uniref:CoA transferase n=1 Tax=Aeribacillus composti TaxID=1868734 RepID=A0ABY9WJH4_9BACI|nr:MULTISPECIES: CoA transferase [Aeribacillus]AXI38714.1 CoA transferase [Bacillaceae bacterium ZC4]REJ14557.1 MAG: CoA transferase [Bacillaceae bacterium]KZM57447.1 formyl-CoA transferase [Aeribacillus pallidus]MDR9793460.1 CoA transferase [Aeribacillus pallidus]MED0650252.1 CoA transferase [Aeribacillus composti]
MEKGKYGPLTGVNILDISTMIAAPFGATLLADLGAEVTKIELPNKGDTLRTVGPWKGNEPLRWPGLARNKKSVTLDIRKEEGKEILKKLIKNTDILIENFRPGTLEKWGLGYEELKKANPKLIMVRISGYGQTGPYREKAGFGTPCTAFSGHTYIQGYPDRPPVSPSYSLLDYITGVYTAFAAVSALYYRDKTDDPEGQVVEMGLYESIFRMLEFLVAEYDQNGIVRERTPGLAGHSSPAGTYETKDGKYVVLVCSTDSTFNRLAEAMERTDMLEDERYYTNSQRLKHDDEVQKIVSDWIRQFTLKELQEKLDLYGVPVSPILSIKDIFENEHYQARKNIVEVEHPRLGKVKVPGVVPNFSKTPGTIRYRAPELGEHNEEILGGKLGLSKQELAELKEKGVI